MNESITKINDKRMTLQEMAAATGAAYRTVADYAQRAGWTQNGVQTLLDEKQVAIIVEAMKQAGVNHQDLPSRVSHIETGVSTKRMTVKEVADALRCDPETVKNHIRELFPNIMRNGVTTYLTETQATIILERLKSPVSSGAKSNLQNEIVGIETSQSRMLQLQILQNQMQAIFDAELADLRGNVARLSDENTQQKQIIGELKPKADYVDYILSSSGTMAITQIAADYGLSANKLNKILRDEGIQRKVNGQWILLCEYMNMGYTDSDTISITHWSIFNNGIGLHGNQGFSGVKNI